MKTLVQALTVLTASLLATACYESAEVTLHEAGEYKGSIDPLTDRDAEERAETLAQRFDQVQTDR